MLESYPTNNTTMKNVSHWII